MKKLFYLLFISGILLTSVNFVSAAEETDTGNPLVENLQESTSTELQENNGLPVPGPDPDEIIGDIQLDPTTGTADISPDVLQQLNESLQLEKSEEDLRREQWIRIGIDVAIGVGAALIFLAIWWLVKLMKKEKREKEKTPKK